MGKGSAPRPYGVPKEQFNNNFDAIFRKKDSEEPKPQESQQHNESQSPSKENAK
jgi:hypothetical protein